MRQHSLLQTKLHTPAIRPELVSRPRLIERLNQGLPRREAFPRALTLVSAPAGFGKTTLLSDWLRQADMRVAWLSLDEGDNDLARFLAYLIAALRTIEISVGKGLLSALQSPQPPPAEAVLTSLINDVVALPHGIILVLDDFHLIEALEIHDAVAFLLQHLPPRLHLAIATREDPHLPLARVRARGQLTELRATDLRFTSSEAAEFLNHVMGLDLSAENVTALERRTEGWIAGLHLAAIALRGTLSTRGHGDTSSFVESFTGSHHFVLDYLVEEVLDQQSESAQAFLLQTSILNRLTSSLCDSLTGHESGQATLEMLERANLFIVPLDEQRRWYRYHRLFADLLRRRLHQTQPEMLPVLHRRASEWYEQSGFVDEAIEHALQTEDQERLARLLDEQAEDIWLRGEHAKLQRWLAKLPDEAVLSRPQLCIFGAWYLFAGGQQAAAERRLLACEQTLEPAANSGWQTLPPHREDRFSDAGRLRLRGMAAVIRAFMATYLGDIGAMALHGRQALEYLPEEELIWRSNAALALGDSQGFRGDVVAAYHARLQAAEAAAQAGDTFFSMMAYMKVAVALREQGQLRQTIAICQREIQRAESSGLPRGSVVGALLAIWAEALAELGELDEAIDLANQGVALTERGLDLAMRGWSYLCSSRIFFSAMDVIGAERIFQRAEAAARDSNLPAWITTQVAAWQARLWLAQGRLQAASEWALQRGLDRDGALNPLHELDFASLLDYVVLGRILIAKGRLDEANRLLPRLLEAADAGGRTSKSIEILGLQALTFQAGDNITQAMTALEQALTLAEPRGFVGLFVDEGPPMARLLYKALSHDIFSDYVRRLLAAFPVTAAEARKPPKSQGAESGLVEPLSERELEVLQLIAEGLTNPEIASRLYLSLNTVKGHTRNIYGKLSVHSRTQAVARARTLGIFPAR